MAYMPPNLPCPLFSDLPRVMTFTGDRRRWLHIYTIALPIGCPVRLPIRLILFKPLPHLLHLLVPIRPQPEPHAHCRAVYERHCQAIPQSVEPHVASERQPDPEGNTCSGHRSMPG
jgi:hypothetical protein